MKDQLGLKYSDLVEIFEYHKKLKDNLYNYTEKYLTKVESELLLRLYMNAQKRYEIIFSDRIKHDLNNF